MKRQTHLYSTEQTNTHTLRKQHLVERAPVTDTAVIAQALLGIHASRYRSPPFSLIARSQAACMNSTVHTLNDQHNLIKIRCIRGTLHLVPIFMASTFHIATEKARLATCNYLRTRCGISRVQHARARAEIVEQLSAGRRSAKELVVNAQQKRSFSSVAIRHAIRSLWEEASLCVVNSGTAWEIEDRRYALLSNEHPGLNMAEGDPIDAQQALLSWYFKAYGPARISDAAWWSGLPPKSIRALLTSKPSQFIVIAINGHGDDFIMCAEDLDHMNATHQPSSPRVRLLAYEDNLLKGYALSRARFASTANLPHLITQGGESRQSILANGQLVGLWTIGENRHIQVQLLKPIDQDTSTLLNAEQQRLSRLLNGAHPKDTHWG